MDRIVQYRYRPQNIRPYPKDASVEGLTLNRHAHNDGPKSHKLNPAEEREEK